MLGASKCNADITKPLASDNNVVTRAGRAFPAADFSANTHRRDDAGGRRNLSGLGAASRSGLSARHFWRTGFRSAHGRPFAAKRRARLLDGIPGRRAGWRPLSLLGPGRGLKRLQAR